MRSKKIQYQRDKLIITGDDLCAECNKRVGVCAFAYYPDRRIVHYGCMDKDKNRVIPDLAKTS